MVERDHPAPEQRGRPSRKQLPTWCYSVAWFCATKEEGEVARACLDERHAAPTLPAYSETEHVYGQIDNRHTSHNIIIVRPIASGKVNMSKAIQHLRQNFPNITASLFVGIAGALPFQLREDDKANTIERGDVVVAQSIKGEPAVVQYDYAGYHGLADFRPKHHADKTADSLQSLFDRWWEEFEEGETDAQIILDQLIAKKPHFAAPEPEADVLFQPDQEHIGSSADCTACKSTYTCYRRRTGEKPGSSYPMKVHRGMILTGDWLIKSAEIRNSIKSQSIYQNALCVDMESAVLMDNWHPLIIRGISDYADSHYGRDWTRYAAATAAAVAKDIIMQMQGGNSQVMVAVMQHNSILRSEHILHSFQDNGISLTNRPGQAASSGLTEPHHSSLYSSHTQNQPTEIVSEVQVSHLGTALRKLGKLSNRLRGPVYGESARKVARHLMTAMACLESSSAGRPSSDHNEDQWAVLRKSLEDCCQVAVNTVPRRFPLTTITRIDRRMECHESEEGELTLTTTIQRSQDESGSEGIQAISILRFRPSLDRSEAPLVAYFGGQIDSFQRSMIHPTIVAFRTVSSSSVVFKLIQDDDLDSFRKLLEGQEATTRDCDELGRSLLNYACYFASPKVCKFLIESGADVNSHEHDIMHPPAILSLLAAFKHNDFEAPKHALSRSLLCRRLLLEAGADPTVSDYIGYEVFVEYFTGRLTATLDNLIQYVNEYYIDWRKLNIEGKNIWLYACQNACVLHTPMILDRLARIGCDVAVVDERGWNCFFHCVLHARRSDTSRELEVLVYLLTNHFDDIQAEDDDGMTVFDHVRNTTGRYGSYHRDLLFEGLARAGYGVTGTSLRSAVYTKWYLPWEHLAMRHMHPSNANRPSETYEALQILARIKHFQKKASRTKGVLVRAQGVRVGGVGDRAHSEVVVSRGVLRRVKGERGERRAAPRRLFRTVRIPLRKDTPCDCAFCRSGDIFLFAASERDCTYASGPKVI